MATKRYQEQPDELRPLIWQQGHVTPWQLLRICAWKSANANLASLSLNDQAQIVERTGQALQVLAPYRSRDVVSESVDWDDWENRVRDAIGSARVGTGLLGLDGVAYPTATAILCILNPGAFPVMDRWTVPNVFSGSPRPERAYFGAGYRAFTEHLAHLSTEQFRGASVHDVDQVVMNAARNGAPLKIPRAVLPRRR